MKIIYKDKDKFTDIMLKKGFNFNSLSLKIGRCRQYIRQSYNNGTIGSESAIRIAEVLEIKYEELFEIV